MTIGERVLNAVDQEKTISGLSLQELASLIEELEARTWWNPFWLEIATLTAEEAMSRICDISKATT